MKLAFIYYAYNTKEDYYLGFRQKAEIMGIDLVVASSIEEYEEKYGAIKDIDGFMLHPYVAAWNHTIEHVKNKHSDKKCALLMWDAREYPNRKFYDTRIINPNDWEEIKEYFSNTGKK